MMYTFRKQLVDMVTVMGNYTQFKVGNVTITVEKKSESNYEVYSLLHSGKDILAESATYDNALRFAVNYIITEDY